MRQAEFHDPRLVPVYDALCGWSSDDDFFLSVVDETPGTRVLDLGCGTGRLTVAMATAGHRVTGVDPARASLAAARARPGGGLVTWIEGGVEAVRDGGYDIAVMTSHVAQEIVRDDEWRRVLAALRRALVPGGRLVFDSRDPGHRAWERWNPVDSRRRVTLPDGRGVDSWTEVTEVRDGAVSFTRHYVFDEGFGDRELLSRSTLRFRTEAELRASLRAAGFAVEKVYGGWAGQPVGQGDGELVVLARRST